MQLSSKVSILTRSLLLLFAIAGGVHIAAAQQAPQEKRIALVVGDGAYAKAPLATAANDAGLIAQTLQAAGFDVIGARDLDADTLRKSFRDFMQKAKASPADTVAVVYLAGYGVQLSGENYFIPVDSNVNSTTDIPIEGLRISDYTRELASVPLKASVVILDAARQQPFVEGPQPLASGLALVEASPNMLIAYNAAPGTVAPSDTGSYGVYAQSLAEMIRTGGLSLPEVFDRVRLRVSETSKGAQIPWDDQKIQAQFSFFDRAPDAPAVQGSPDQVAAIRQKPMRALSVQDAYAAALTRDTMQGYQDFIGAYPTDPLARRVRAILAARREAITWRRTYLTDTPQAYWSYLRRYPDGPHAWDARRRLSILNALLEPPPSFAMIDYDVPPPPPDEFVYVDRPVFYFGDPGFGFVPPPPPPIYYLPPPPPDFVVLAPPFAAVGLFILPQPLFVPIPVYCRPPVYVASPPNNIIFNNIHNTTVINNVINVPPPQVAAGNVASAAAAAASAKPVGATTPVPNVVRTQAQAIQKNPTQQLRPSQQAFVSNPAAKAGNMVVTPAKLTPATTAPTIQPEHALPGSKTGTELPRTNTVNPTATAPNAKGVNENAKVTSPTVTTNPNAKGVNTNTKLTSPTEAAKPNTREEKSNVEGGRATPTTTTTNPTTPGKPTATQTRPNTGEHDKRLSTAPTSQTSAKPEPKPQTTLAKPEVKPEPKQTRPEARSAARPMPPPSAPKPEARRATPPPPPPKPAAAPPPPPRPAFAAAPKPPPPPPPKLAAPRPPPPPPKPAAKHCPANNPKC